MSSASLPLPPTAARLWNRNFSLLWQGQAISLLGNRAYSVAVMFWTMERTASASLVGLLMAAAIVPGVLLAPLGGTFADRHARVRILIGCDLGAGMAVLALAFLLRFDPPVRVVLVGLFSVAILGGILRSFLIPAVQASIPEIVPRERLASANSLNQFAVQMSLFVGQAAGGVLYQRCGAFLLLLFDGLSFLFAAGSSSLINLPQGAPASELQGAGRGLRDFLGHTRSGVRYVLALRGLRNFIFIASQLNFFFTPVLVLLPFYVRNQLCASADWYGYLLAGLSAGTVAGFLLAGTLRLQGRLRASTLLGCLVLGPGLSGLLGVVHMPILAVGLTFLIGTCFGMVNVYMITLLQASTPNEMRGRVLGFVTTLAAGLMPLGMALSGWIGDLAHKNVSLIFGTAGTCSGAFALLLSMDQKSRAFLGQEISSDRAALNTPASSDR